MLTPAQLASIYDFQNVMEVALKALFTANQVKAFTSQFVVSTGKPQQDQALQDQGFDILVYQRDRPRVEILFTPGAGQERWRATVVNGVETAVETSWSGQFKLDVITIPDIRVHSAFVIMVRFLMHTQLLSLNGTSLLRHRIQPQHKDAGTTPLMHAETGDFQTTVLFDVDFSVQDDAWAVLA